MSCWQKAGEVYRRRALGREKGFLNSALAEKPNNYLAANLYYNICSQLLNHSAVPGRPFQLTYQANLEKVSSLGAEKRGTRPAAAP